MVTVTVIGQSGGTTGLSSGTGTSIKVVLSTPTAVNGGILLFIGHNGGLAANAISVTDTAGNPYSKQGAAVTPSSGFVVEAWFAPTSSSVNNVQITITLPSTQQISALAYELAANGTVRVDNTGPASSGTSINPNAQAIISQPPETAFLGVISDVGGSPIGASGGDSVLSTITTGGTILGGLLQNLTSSIPMFATLSAPVQWAAITVSFAVNTPAPPPPPPSPPNPNTPQNNPTIPTVTPGIPTTLTVGANKNLCVTRAIKNAKFIQSRASALLAAAGSNPSQAMQGLAAAGFSEFNPNYIIPTNEPAGGYFSVVPLSILSPLVPISGIGTGFFAGPAGGLYLPSPDTGMNNAPNFNGTLYIVLVSYADGSGQTFSVPTADVQTVLAYLLQTAPDIIAYLQQYGVTNVVVSTNIINFTGSVNRGFTFTDQFIAGQAGSSTLGWADQIAQQYGMNPNGTNNALLFLCPSTVTNLDCVPGQGMLGYHSISQGGIPYVFVPVTGTGLTIGDTADNFALAVSHEVAEMLNDPYSTLSEPDCCDPCGPNAQATWRAYFDSGNNYLGTTQAFPPAFNYYTFINGIVQPPSATLYPPPPNACAYSPVALPIGSIAAVVSTMNPTQNSQPAVIAPDYTNVLGVPAPPPQLIPSLAKVQNMKTQQLPGSSGPAVIKLPIGS